MSNFCNDFEPHTEPVIDRDADGEIIDIEYNDWCSNCGFSEAQHTTEPEAWAEADPILAFQMGSWLGAGLFVAPSETPPCMAVGEATVEEVTDGLARRWWCDKPSGHDGRHRVITTFGGDERPLSMMDFGLATQDTA